MRLALLQFSLAITGFSLIPALYGDVWAASPEPFRWTVFASQALMLLSGLAGGFALSRSQPVTASDSEKT